MPPVDRLSAAQARRLALAAQGFDRRRPSGAVDRRHLRRLVGTLGLLQIDSVNVLARAHYLPAFARLGPYPRGALDRMAWQDHELFEYWAHEASLLPVELWPYCRWRMAAIRGKAGWGRAEGLLERRPGYVEAVLEEVRERGPLSARELSDPGGRAGQWWGWADGKTALEALFAWGELTVAGRVNFERRYDLPERVLPAAVLAAPAVDGDEARREMLRISARALGVATAGDLCDYFRLHGPRSAPRLAELVEAGELLPVTVEGWRQQAYLWHEARLPRWIRARALLSPFDSLVFERSRAERLFDFHYRIEIYTPAPKRVYGYYVLPFLLGDRLVGRIDLKADRKAGALVVQAAHGEPGAPPETVPELAEELALMASWLGLDRVDVVPRGDLGPALAAAVRPPRPAPARGGTGGRLDDDEPVTAPAPPRAARGGGSTPASTASGRRGR
ncbi:MAG: winged helix-turn-helix domain-containing protein [Frankiaceae bacterium]